MPQDNLWLIPSSSDVRRPTSDVLRAWRTRPDVLSVYPNQSYRIQDTAHPMRSELFQAQQTTIPWNLSQISISQAWSFQINNNFPAQGKGIAVAVLDTGVDPNQPALKQVMQPLVDVWAIMHPNIPLNPPSCSSTIQIVPGADRCTAGGKIYDWTGKDGNGHGTHVTGILAAQPTSGLSVLGVAPQATVLPIKVANFQGGTDAATLLRGINEALAAGARVISVSIGGSSDNDGTLTNPAALREGVEAAIQRGAVFTAANGNEGNQVPVDLPAAYPNVIAVAATTRIGTIGSYSNTGPETTVAAPGGSALASEGGGIVSTWPSYLTADDLARSSNPRVHLTQSLAGTSMSTPHVAGVAALLLAQEPNLSPQQIRVRLAGTVDPLDSNGFSTFAGFGQINALRALERRRHDGQ